VVLVPARRLDPEWIDREGNAPEDLAAALADIRAVNRLLGGRRVVVDAIAPYLRAAPRDAVLRILDVGTGSADVPIAIAKAASRMGRRVEIVAIDRDPATVELARRAASGHPAIRVLRADAFAPGFPDGSFDLVVASMVLHHFPHDDAVRFVEVMRRLARRAVLVNDLRRHALAWAFIALAARLTWRHPMFVHDAPLSVLRGFTDRELARIAEDAGASGATVVRRWPYRLLLTVPA
jgi:SAM-dependent methyltransferase